MTEEVDEAQSGTITLTAPVTQRTPPCYPPNSTLGYGDIDGDGYVTQGDSTAAVNCWGAVTTPEGVRADVNGDGYVNNSDIALIQQYIDGEIDTFPVCGGEPKKSSWILWLAILYGAYRVLGG